jgi:hypothetical protein
MKVGEIKDEIDLIAQQKWEEAFQYLKNVDGLMGVKILIDCDNILQKYNLSNEIQFILNIDESKSKYENKHEMEFYYSGIKIKPDGRIYGVERKVSLLELLTECTLQKKWNPDIKHLQVNSVENIREDKLNTLIK